MAQRHVNGGAEAAILGDDSFSRIANLLALLLVKGESEMDKVLTLTSVGYSATEVGNLLGKLPNTVSVILYKARRVSRQRVPAKGKVTRGKKRT
jgi:hypothetical protein